MKNIIAALMLLISIPASAQLNKVLFNQHCDAKPKAEDFAPGEVLVKFKDSESTSVRKVAGRFNSIGVSAADQVLSRFGIENMERAFPNEKKVTNPRKTIGFHGETIVQHDLTQIYHIKKEGMSADSTLLLIDELNQLESVEFAEPNYIFRICADETEVVTTNDPYFSQQWGLNAINLPQLWAKPKITDKRIVIAILDTGVDITHPDLKDNIWTNEGEIPDNGIDDDGNGYVDDVHGYDLYNDSPDVIDNHFHGTHCAGIAAAVGNNNKGVVGAAPDALIMPLAIGGPTMMMTAGEEGILYAINAGADIISMSWGGSSDGKSFRMVMENASQSAILVGGAGNSAHTIEASDHCVDCQKGGVPFFPAAYNCVLGVEASSKYGTRADFSNWDNNGPKESNALEDGDEYNYELMAPGKDIMSTYPGGSYKSLSGTSMACPFAAGAIAALLERKEYSSRGELYADLVQTRTPYKDIDILAAYDVKDEERTQDVRVVNYAIDDSANGDNDGIIDGGEDILLYPSVKNFWKDATGVRCSLTIADETTARYVTLTSTDVTIGDLGSFEHRTATDAFAFSVSEDCPDEQELNFVISSICNEGNSNERPVTIVAENAIVLDGILAENYTMKEGVKYIIKGRFLINKVLTIEPGVVVKLEDEKDVVVSGSINANGTPDKMIKFCIHNPNEHSFTNTFKTLKSTSIGRGNAYFKYTEFDGLNTYFEGINMENCVIHNFKTSWPLMKNCRLTNCNIYNNHLYGECPGNSLNGAYCDSLTVFRNCNIVSNYAMPIAIQVLDSCNVFGNIMPIGNNAITSYYYSDEATTYQPANPSYFGFSDDNTLHSLIADANWTYGQLSPGVIDFDYVLREPSQSAHAVVASVTVDGQDITANPVINYGNRHFAITFSKPMNTSICPILAVGDSIPDKVIMAKYGTWSSDKKTYSCDVNIFANLLGDIDGHIIIYGAEEEDRFPVADDVFRYNVQLRTAAFMTDNFSGKGCSGYNYLTWGNIEEENADVVGYRIAHAIASANVGIQDIEYINDSVMPLTTHEFYDYEVMPGTTYGYLLIAVMKDGSEVACAATTLTPLEPIMGDVNASEEVDVADVVAMRNYLDGKEVNPFVKSAADIDENGSINIDDLQNIAYQTILTATSPRTDVEKTASYKVENGTLYLTSPVPLAGIQVQLGSLTTEPVISKTFDDWNSTTNKLGENSLAIMAYSEGENLLAAGQTALMTIGDAKVTDIRLSDELGHNVWASDSTNYTFTLTYFVDGEQYEQQILQVGDSIKLIDEPTREGYTFSGWSEVPDVMPTHDVEVYGTFAVNQYTITFDTDGGTAVQPITQDYGTEITAPANPTKEGYTFARWNPEVPKTMPATDMTIKALWTINSYKLTYKVDGAVYKEYDIDYNTAITPEAEPTKVGYVFSGWSEIPATMPAHNVEVTGSFTKGSYSLTYYVDDVLYQTYGYDYQDEIIPIEKPVREGYSFSDWTGFPSDMKMPEHDVRVDCVSSINSYKLTYFVDGNLYKEYSIEYNSAITPAEEPSKEGYTFSGWSNLPSVMPAHDVEATGSFYINQYAVNYVVDGNPYMTDYVYFGETIVLISDPYREGYIFSGWSGYPDDMKMPSHDITITGAFEIDGIQVITLLENVEGIYTLGGMKVEKLHRGIYVVRFFDGTIKTITIK